MIVVPPQRNLFLKQMPRTTHGLAESEYRTELGNISVEDKRGFIQVVKIRVFIPTNGCAKTWGPPLLLRMSPLPEAKHLSGLNTPTQSRSG